MASSSIITIDDFESICRLCLKKDRCLKPIFKSEISDSEQNGISTLDQMIAECFGLEVIELHTLVRCIRICNIKKLCHSQINPDDGLPLLICNSCSWKLTEGYSFRAMCIASADFLLNVKNEPKPEKYFPEIVYVSSKMCVCKFARFIQVSLCLRIRTMTLEADRILRTNTEPMNT